jgi:hypothetical protein
VRRLLKDVISKNGQSVLDCVMADLLVCESDVKPWVEDDDDLGSDWEEFEESETESETSATDSDANTNAASPTRDASQRPITTVVLEPSTPGAKIPKGHKRMRPRYATCANCKEEFDVSCNEKGDCRYHPRKPLTVVSYNFPVL